MAAGCILAGWYKAKQLAVRVSELERLRRLISYFKTEIRYGGAPVGEILRRKRSEAAWVEDCVSRMENGESFPDAWKNCAEAAWLVPQDRELLLLFGEGLGASDTQGQLAHCALFEERTEENLRDAKENRARKSKLYLMLGICAGAAVSILLA